MSELERASTTAQNEGESQEKLVDDLVDEQDYWLSVTDAARVTRRQEITIRRWIAAGELAVRRQRMGLNKRTRHVRASDLARLTPIIDPMATITGAPANADLLSIPVQQARLLTTQQEQAERLTSLDDMVASLIMQRTSDLGSQAQQHQTLLAFHRETNDNIQTMHQEFEQRHHHLQAQLDARMQSVYQQFRAINEQNTQEATQRRTEAEQIARQVAGLEETIDQLTENVKNQFEQERLAWELYVQSQAQTQRQQGEAFEAHLRALFEHQLTNIQQEWQLRFTELAARHDALQTAFIAEQHRRQRLTLRVKQLRRAHKATYQSQRKISV
jgi:hypothetical protein